VLVTSNMVARAVGAAGCSATGDGRPRSTRRRVGASEHEKASPQTASEGDEMPSRSACAGGGGRLGVGWRVHVTCR
jgi:hypothetical protein